MKTYFTDEEVSFFESFEKTFFPAGSTIISPGVRLECLYYLKEGKCTRALTTVSGDFLVYDRRINDRSTQSLIGILCFYLKEPFSSFTFIADTDCTCYRIPPDAAKQFFIDHPRHMQSLLEFLVQCYSELNRNMLCKLSHSTPASICSYILENEVDENGIKYLDPSLNISEIGRRLGIHRVTVSRIISTLVKEKILIKEGSRIRIIDESRLSSYASYELELKY